ncbi:PREDICTED: jmjC domain-containing protein 4, partial [Nicrophorus vespilloides]|uniref:Jumonji domain-containing protein 4 n=1 Tax=Nicrophorus vespilloides TaxID=110193 RepID=A0ABM1MH09_NICVS
MNFPHCLPLAELEECDQSCIELPEAFKLNCSYLDHLPVLESKIPYNYFFHEYMLKNQACLIRNVSSKWESQRFWIKDADNLDFNYLKSKYGSLDVTVYDCNKKYYNSQEANQMKFSKYLEHWESFKKSGYSDDLPLLYLKDWHLKNQLKDDKFYIVPKYFASDWLNEYLVENNKDDYRFVYMGPKSTWTQFHADVFNSYSWSTNIFGQKKWIIFPPGEEKKLKDKIGNLPYRLETIPESVKYLEVIQNPGDAIFVPSGWHHQVTNLTDTISVNHNWVNGCNIKLMWLEFVETLKNVKKEIDDCKSMENFHAQCQVLLKSTFGLDFKDFFDFLKYICSKRLQKTDNHSIFDLQRIKEILLLFSAHEDVDVLELRSN